MGGLVKVHITIRPYIVQNLDPGVQSIVSLTSLLRGPLVKCVKTFLPNTHIFFVEKMRAFALQTQQAHNINMVSY